MDHLLDIVIQEPAALPLLAAIVAASLASGSSSRCGAPLSSRTLRERQSPSAKVTCTITARGIGTRCGHHRGGGRTRTDVDAALLYGLAAALLATAVTLAAH